MLMTNVLVKVFVMAMVEMMAETMTVEVTSWNVLTRPGKTCLKGGGRVAVVL